MRLRAIAGAFVVAACTSHGDYDTQSVDAIVTILASSCDGAETGSASTSPVGAAERASGDRIFGAPTRGADRTIWSTWWGAHGCSVRYSWEHQRDCRRSIDALVTRLGSGDSDSDMETTSVSWQGTNGSVGYFIFGDADYSTCWVESTMTW